jgi:hypothetical protein
MIRIFENKDRERRWQNNNTKEMGTKLYATFVCLTTQAAACCSEHGDEHRRRRIS